MLLETVMFQSAESAAKQLEKLGIPLRSLVVAAQRGFVERGFASPFDPVTAPGTDAWRYTVRSLRMDLEGLGWRMDDPQNLPLIVNDELRLNVTVSSGDENTGNPFKIPKSKNPKGTLLESAVRRNSLQKDLFPELLPVAEVQFHRTITYPTWIFLVHITDEAIKAELSLPNSYGENNHLDGWRARIIIDVPLPDELGDFESEADTGIEIVPDIKPKI